MSSDVIEDSLLYFILWFSLCGIILLFFLLTPLFVSASNFTSPSYSVTKSQFSTFTFNKTSNSFGIDVYNPDQLVFNVSSLSYDLCFGYHCLGVLSFNVTTTTTTTTTTLPSGGGGGGGSGGGINCSAGYISVLLNGNYYCAPTGIIDDIIDDIKPKNYWWVLLLILLIVYLEYRLRKNKRDSQSQRFKRRNDDE